MPTSSYTYTGAYIPIVIPAGVTSIEADLYGAEGYNLLFSPRKGNRVKGTIAVTPLEELRLFIGGSGKTGTGFNGGGFPGGGGGTDLRRAPYAEADRLLVAGGAGGEGRIGQNNTGGTSWASGLGVGSPGGDASGATGGTAGSAGNLDIDGTAGDAGTTGDGGDGGAGADDFPNGNGGTGGGGGGGRAGGGGGGGGAIDQKTTSIDVYAGGPGGDGSNYLGAATSTLEQFNVRSGNGRATITYASNVAPNTPVPSDPAPGANADLAAGYTFKAPFSDPNPGDTIAAVAWRAKVNGTGTWEFWDDTLAALVASEVWNPQTTSDVPIPPGILSNGVTYDWGTAHEDNHGNRSGYSATQTVVGNTKPTVTITGPATPVTTSSKPPVTWTSADAEGNARTHFEVIVETGAFGAEPGDGTQVDASGTQAGAPGTWTPTASLDNLEDFRYFVRVKAGGQWSLWDTWDFETDLAAPTAPTYTVATDPATGKNVLLVTGTHATASFPDTTFKALRSYDYDSDDPGSATWELVDEVAGNGTPGATPVAIDDPYPRTYKTAYYQVFTVAEV